MAAAAVGNIVSGKARARRGGGRCNLIISERRAGGAGAGKLGVARRKRDEAPAARSRPGS